MAMCDTALLEAAVDTEGEAAATAGDGLAADAGAVALGGAGAVALDGGNVEDGAHAVMAKPIATTR